MARTRLAMFLQAAANADIEPSDIAESSTLPPPHLPTTASSPGLTVFPSSSPAPSFSPAPPMHVGEVLPEKKPIPIHEVAKLKKARGTAVTFSKSRDKKKTLASALAAAASAIAGLGLGSKLKDGGGKDGDGDGDGDGTKDRSKSLLASLLKAQATREQQDSAARTSSGAGGDNGGEEEEFTIEERQKLKAQLAEEELERFERVTSQVVVDFTEFLRKVGEDDLDAEDIDLFLPSLSGGGTSSKSTVVRLDSKDVPRALAQRMHATQKEMHMQRLKTRRASSAAASGPGHGDAHNAHTRPLHLVYVSKTPPPPISSFNPPPPRRAPRKTSYGKWYLPISEWGVESDPHIPGLEAEQGAPAPGAPGAPLPSEGGGGGAPLPGALPKVSHKVAELAEDVAQLKSSVLFLDWLTEREQKDPRSNPIPPRIKQYAAITRQAERERRDASRLRAMLDRQQRQHQELIQAQHHSAHSAHSAHSHPRPHPHPQYAHRPSQHAHRPSQHAHRPRRR